MEPPLPPLVAGRVDELRRGVRDRVRAGRSLLSRLDAAEDVLCAIPDEKLPPKTLSLGEFERAAAVNRHLAPTERAYWSWYRSTVATLERFFGARARELFGVVDAPRWSRRISDEDIPIFREAIGVRLSELESVSKRLGEGTSRHMTQSAASKLDFLRSSAAIDVEIVDDLEKRLGAIRDRRNVRRAIGAAKELVEAVSSGALLRMGVEPPKADDLMALAKLTRQELSNRVRAKSSASTEIERSAIKFEAGLTSIVNALAEMRNSHGEGHGRPMAPNGLEVRHGQLAVDVAVAYSRYVVTAIADLGLG